MKFESEARRDALQTKLYLQDDPAARGADEVIDLFKVFAAHALSPQHLTKKGRAKKYSPEAVRELFSKSGTSVIVNASRDRDPEMSATLQFRAKSAWPLGLFADWRIDMAYFESDDGREHARAVCEVIQHLCSSCDPLYGFAHSAADFDLTADPHRTDPFAPKEVYEVYWLNVLGRAMVEQIGRARVMSTPAARVQPLPQGGVLILTTESPSNVTSEPARRAQAAALAHLRDDISLEAALQRFAERDRQLAPVERSWDPDLAELFELMADEVPFSHRQGEIARFNAYHPPEVSEVRAEALPPDVDGSAARTSYEGHAEQLVALLHSKVKGVSSNAPEALPLIDLHFYVYDYPGTFERSRVDTLIPAVGAYLGELLVRHLGGRWIPRRNLDESQVAVGSSVWLPFARARHYLSSKQAALDYSLTKFFRVAQRESGAKQP